jgi:thymidylate kinase
LRTRRRHERDFWVPAANVEFICVLVNRIVKGKLEANHTDQLSRLWMQNRELCAHEMFRFFNSGAARMVADAAEANDWSMVHERMRELRKEFLRLSVLRQPTGYVMRVLGSQVRRVSRWLMPQSGLHVVFLGPDGVGKSTTIEMVQQRVTDAFLCVKYQTFARSILPNKPKAGPHALPPRSRVASYLKAAWWELCYTAGYLKSVHPTRCRGGLAINHRYLIDAIVDPKRYRYSGPQELLWAIWATAFKPDLLIFLDAPAEVIQARKQETTAEETARQVEAYRAMAARLPNAKLVDTSVSREQTVQQVTEIILGTMANRIARRFKSR